MLKVLLLCYASILTGQTVVVLGSRQVFISVIMNAEQHPSFRKHHLDKRFETLLNTLTIKGLKTFFQRALAQIQNGDEAAY